MVIQTKVRGFICTTAHPIGCEKAVKEQIDYVKGIFSEKEEKWFFSKTAEKVYF